MQSSTLLDSQTNSLLRLARRVIPALDGWNASHEKRLVSRGKSRGGAHRERAFVSKRAEDVEDIDGYPRRELEQEGEWVSREVSPRRRMGSEDESSTLRIDRSQGQTTKRYVSSSRRRPRHRRLDPEGASDPNAEASSSSLFVPASSGKEPVSGRLSPRFPRLDTGDVSRSSTALDSERVEQDETWCRIPSWTLHGETRNGPVFPSPPFPRSTCIADHTDGVKSSTHARSKGRRIRSAIVMGSTENSSRSCRRGQGDQSSSYADENASSDVLQMWKGNTDHFHNTLNAYMSSTSERKPISQDRPLSSQMRLEIAYGIYNIEQCSRSIIRSRSSKSSSRTSSRMQDSEPHEKKNTKKDVFDKHRQYLRDLHARRDAQFKTIEEEVEQRRSAQAKLRESILDRIEREKALVHPIFDHEHGDGDYQVGVGVFENDESKASSSFTLNSKTTKSYENSETHVSNHEQHRSSSKRFELSPRLKEKNGIYRNSAINCPLNTSHRNRPLTANTTISCGSKLSTGKTVSTTKQSSTSDSSSCFHRLFLDSSRDDRYAACDESIGSMKQWKAAHHIHPNSKIFTMAVAFSSLRDALLLRGWVQNPRSDSPFFDFRWSYGRPLPFEVERSLRHEQMVSYLDNHQALTTKTGLMESLSRLKWISDTDVNLFFPRCFDLTEGMDEFYDAFRFSAAVSVIRYLVENPRQGMKEMTTDLVLLALRGCRRYLAEMEHLRREFEDPITIPFLSEDEWSLVLEFPVSCKARYPPLPCSVQQQELDSKIHRRILAATISKMQNSMDCDSLGYMSESHKRMESVRILSPSVAAGAGDVESNDVDDTLRKLCEDQGYPLL